MKRHTEAETREALQSLQSSLRYFIGRYIPEVAILADAIAELVELRTATKAFLADRGCESCGLTLVTSATYDVIHECSLSKLRDLLKML